MTYLKEINIHEKVGTIKKEGTIAMINLCKKIPYNQIL